MATFGLVHGAWHGAWCWELLMPELDRRGHEAVAVDLPTDDPGAGLTRYADLVSDALGHADDVVLVGHSLGAAAIPLVARRLPVTRLVFLCAIVPRPGESVTDRYREEPVFAAGFAGNTAVTSDGASYWPDAAAARACLFHDCPDDLARRAFARLRPQSAAARLERWPPDPLPPVERVSIVCRDDRAVSPDWSLGMSRADLGVEPTELDGGHSPFLSRPAELAELLCHDV